MSTLPIATQLKSRTAAKVFVGLALGLLVAAIVGLIYVHPGGG